MFLIDRLLIGLPIAGVKFVFKQIADIADREMSDQDVIREQIVSLHRAYEAGSIDDATFAAEEKALMARWRAARDRAAARGR